MAFITEFIIPHNFSSRPNGKTPQVGVEPTSRVQTQNSPSYFGAAFVFKDEGGVSNILLVSNKSYHNRSFGEG